MDKAAFTKQYLSGVDFSENTEHQDYIMARFPESEEMVRERA